MTTDENEHCINYAVEKNEKNQIEKDTFKMKVVIFKI